MTKVLYKNRLMAEYVMGFAWALSGPALKTFYGLFPEWFFSMTAVWILVVGLLQKPLRKKFSVVELIKMVIVGDLIYIAVTLALVLLQNIKGMVIFDEIAMGPYMALLVAAAGKLDSYYLGKFKSYQQEIIRSTVGNNRIKIRIAAFALSGILMMFISIYELLLLQITAMAVGVYYEVKALRP